MPLRPTYKEPQKRDEKGPRATLPGHNLSQLTGPTGESAVFEDPKFDGPNVVCYRIVDGKTLHERLEGKKSIPPSNMPYTRASAEVRLP